MSAPFKLQAPDGVYAYDNTHMIMELEAASVPADGTAGYASGCLLKLTTAVVGATLYINEGSATSCDFNPVSTRPAPIVVLTAATLALTAALHDGKTIVVNKADGAALTLPAATGSGLRIRVIIGTTITSVGTTIKVANASDTMVGGVLVLQDAGSTVAGFEAGSTDDTITLNGSTTAGIKGDEFVLEDVAVNLWVVWGRASGTGIEATPFSATV